MSKEGGKEPPHVGVGDSTTSGGRGHRSSCSGRVELELLEFGAVGGGEKG